MIGKAFIKSANNKPSKIKQNFYKTNLYLSMCMVLFKIIKPLTLITFEFLN